MYIIRTGSFTMPCLAVGEYSTDYSSSFQWMRKETGLAVNGPRYTVTKNGGLKLTNADTTDSGNYSCTFGTKGMNAPLKSYAFLVGNGRIIISAMKTPVWQWLK